MKFKIYVANEMKYDGEIIISSIGDLQRLSEKYNDERLIVDFDSKEVIIYDGWIE